MVLSLTSIFNWFCSIVAILERNVWLKVATVGDCGLRIIRKGKYQILSIYSGSSFSILFSFFIDYSNGFNHLINLLQGK